MQIKPNIIQLKNLQKTLLCALCFVLALPHAFAADADTCIAGLPCVVDATPNDPFVDNDGPNFDGENAPKSVSQACDADFMNQIYAKAYIEAEREIVNGQVVMRKPDSILEYTCFDQVVGMTATAAAPIFSESQDWNNKAIEIVLAGDNTYGSPELLGPLSSTLIVVDMSGSSGVADLGGALGSLVLEGLTNYRDANFAHDFLGGYADSQNSTLSTSADATSYSCTMMNNIFLFSRCDDFANEGQFYSFAQLAGVDADAPLDPRILPAACASDAPRITPELIALANNDEFKHVSFDKYDPTFVINLDAQECDTPPVPTGVSVKRQKVERDFFGNQRITETIEYEESTCVDPGCHFEPDDSGGRCVK